MSKLYGADQDAKVTVRVSQDLLDDYDRALDELGTNRSEHIRQLMRSTVGAPDSDGKIPPQDDEILAKGYKAIRQVSGGKAVPQRVAKSAVAQKTSIPAESVPQRVLRPLVNRNYLQFCGDPLRDQWVKLR